MSVELVEHGREPRRRPDVISRREQVARVEAQRQALRTVDATERRAQILGPGAESVPRSRSVLQGDPDSPPLGAADNLVQGGDQLTQPRVDAGAPVGARVQDDDG